MNDMQQTIINAFNFRHATKRFDSNKKINESEFDTILEAGRLSPSSLGLEPWKFIVIQNSEIRNKLKEISWGAKGQLDTASHFVIILARKNVTSKSPFVQHMIEILSNTAKIVYLLRKKNSIISKQVSILMIMHKHCWNGLKNKHTLH